MPARQMSHFSAAAGIGPSGGMTAVHNNWLTNGILSRLAFFFLDNALLGRTSPPRSDTMTRQTWA